MAVAGKRSWRDPKQNALTTPEAIARLRARHPVAKGQWANIVEFLNIDFVAVGCWLSLEYAVHGYEIKVSRNDWLKQLKKPHKADDGMLRCDYWYLAAPPGILRDGELPPKWGYVELGAKGSRVVHRPERLRPKPTRTPYYTENGALVENQDFMIRHTFAMLARRFAYEQADREALASLTTPEDSLEALDAAARRTGRLDSKDKALNKRFAQEERQRRADERIHNAHRKAGIEYGADCPYGWCKQFAEDAPDFVG